MGPLQALLNAGKAKEHLTPPETKLEEKHKKEKKVEAVEIKVKKKHLKRIRKLLEDSYDSYSHKITSVPLTEELINKYGLKKFPVGTVFTGSVKSVNIPARYETLRYNHPAPRT